ncbi:MAG: PhnD/SsuA/transferrin family substrate-binding protein [Micropruina sp.]|nr:PhnD/SsuA/transferrin family substrate-binding protein [Micropruina sp.]
METLVVGAVAYTANVVPIWEGIRDYFRGSAVEMDFVLFSNYERQVDALLAGHVDVAWNTNLAYLRTVGLTAGGCRALAMRDTDLAFRTVFVARRGSGLQGLESVRGARVALGSKDSGQARILPIKFLADAGITLDAVTPVIFDSDVGKHGDTGRSELDALQAVLSDDADVAALGITTWQQLKQAGELGVEEVWTSPAYCHCNFTALSSLDEARAEAWTSHLLAMDWDVPQERRILEMEGLRRWVRPELAGYRSLQEAMREQAIPLTW